MPETPISIGFGFKRTTPGLVFRRRDLEHWTSGGVRYTTTIEPRLRTAKVKAAKQRVAQSPITPPRPQAARQPPSSPGVFKRIRDRFKKIGANLKDKRAQLKKARAAMKAKRKGVRESIRQIVDGERTAVSVLNESFACTE